ncbi:MAG: selenium-dependent molybdenum cofactor biosynthesis protein YqeB [Tissierellaceae bacterium]
MEKSFINYRLFEVRHMDIVAIRGGGDIATGIAHRLYMAGFKIVIFEIEKPLSIRRRVCFSEAIYEDAVVVEGINAVHVKKMEDIESEISKGNIPVYIDGSCNSIRALNPSVVVDSILAKRNLGTTRDLASITIGIGPGFEAGIDVDAVIESKRGHNLGRVIYRGKAQENTGIPGVIMGHGEDRVIRATRDGNIINLYEIGDKVEKGTPICKIEDEYIYAKITGIIRGLIKDGLFVNKGLKIGDIDPRMIEENAFTISDKARAIGGGVLEAILCSQRRIRDVRDICIKRHIRTCGKGSELSISNYY